MHSQKREHIDAVVRVAYGDSAHSLTDAAQPDLIHDSWRRCVQQHHLDPTRQIEPLILPHTQLREHQDRAENFLQVARHGLESLYLQIARLGYCILLTDAQGITVDYMGDPAHDADWRRAGLYLGADWHESRGGTNGVGTCIATGEALTVHLRDHFDAANISLSCTTAPIFNPQGQLQAVLDISQLQPPQSKDSQLLALNLVKMVSRQIENATFLQNFRHDWVLRLNQAPQFLEISPEYLVALDSEGRVIGHNRQAQLLLGATGQGPAMGLPFESLFNARLQDLGRFTTHQLADQRAVTLAGSGQMLFMLVSQPAPRRPSSRPDTGASIPAPLARLCGGDAGFLRQIERAARLVNAPVTLLLNGETGSGKEAFAKALHASGERRDKPFIAVNCAAIPPSLIESELFGYMPGSFSGALPKGKKGLIQDADRGTLFLDEIGDMPRELQARLLRVLSEREITPIGGSSRVPVDIRVIAATHRDLKAMVREGTFREDLLYRLNGALIQIPPLRGRSDLPWLMDRLLNPASGGEDHPPWVLSPPARAVLLQHRWPGNVRELLSVLEFARAVCTGRTIEIHDLPDDIRPDEAIAGDTHSPDAPAQAPDDEAALMLQYLRAARWNISAVARQMGVTRMTLYRRMARHGIESPNNQTASPPPEQGYPL